MVPSDNDVGGVELHFCVIEVLPLHGKDNESDMAGLLTLHMVCTLGRDLSSGLWMMVGLECVKVSRSLWEILRCNEPP